MKRVRPTTLAFGVSASLVVVISALLTLKRGDAAMRPDPARFSGSRVVQRLPSILASPRIGASVTAAIIRDETAASFYDSPAILDSIVEAWRDALSAAGVDARVLTSAAARDDRTTRVFVLPSSPCLSIATHEALESATNRGLGVILTGSSGTYDAACRPIGYGVIVGATGASRAEVLDAREMTYVTFPSGSPLSADIPPGSRLDLNPGGQVALRHPTRDAFYSDYALQPQPARQEPLLDAAVTHSMLGRGRVVYWGFELRDVVARPWDRAIARLLVRNSVAWAAGQPIASVEPWQRGKLAAASIAQDVEAGFGNARHALDSLRAAKVPSTFFLTSELAQRFERLSRRMAEFGEIGTHSENHRLLGGLPADVQQRRLTTTQRELTRLIGKPVPGLRPPEEQFDAATLSGWLEVGGRYLFGANDSRSAAPELLAFGNDTLVLVGRIGSDDFAAAATRAPTTKHLTSVFLDEYERVRALRGHYVLSYHSQLLARPELVPALAMVARRLAADTAVWLATTGDIADWWRARAGLEAHAQLTSERMSVVVRNRGARLVRGAVVRVSMPEARRARSADTRLLPQGDSATVRLFLPPMPARTTRTFTVAFSESGDVERVVRPKRPPARRGFFRWWPW